MLIRNNGDGLYAYALDPLRLVTLYIIAVPGSMYLEYTLYSFWDCVQKYVEMKRSGKVSRLWKNIVLSA